MSLMSAMQRAKGHGQALLPEGRGRVEAWFGDGAWPFAHALARSVLPKRNGTMHATEQLFWGKLLGQCILVARRRRETQGLAGGQEHCEGPKGGLVCTVHVEHAPGTRVSS